MSHILSYSESCPTAGILRIHVSTSIDEGSGYVWVASLSGSVQRSAAATLDPNLPMAPAAYYHGRLSTVEIRETRQVRNDKRAF